MAWRAPVDRADSSWRESALAVESGGVAGSTRRLDHQTLLRGRDVGDSGVGPHRSARAGPVRARRIPGISLSVGSPGRAYQGHRTKDERCLAVGRGAVPAQVPGHQRTAAGVRSSKGPAVHLGGDPATRDSDDRRAKWATRGLPGRIFLADDRRPAIRFHHRRRRPRRTTRAPPDATHLGCRALQELLRTRHEIRR